MKIPPSGKAIEEETPITRKIKILQSIPFLIHFTTSIKQLNAAALANYLLFIFSHSHTYVNIKRC